MKNIFVLAIVLCLAIPTVSFSQQGLTKTEKIEAIYNANKKRIATNNYIFVASWVFSDNQRTEVAEDANTLTINTSNVNGNLSRLDANKPSIMLKGAAKAYAVNYNDNKNFITISFKNGAYNAEINVHSNGFSFLTLTDSSGKSLKYRGVLK